MDEDSSQASDASGADQAKADARADAATPRATQAPRAPRAPQAPQAPKAARTSKAAAGTEEGSKADLDDVKRQFRAALDRKKSANASESGATTRNAGKVHSSHGPATSRRSFRRKSG